MSRSVGDGGTPTEAKVQFRLRISKGEDIAVGPGKVALLEQIGATGSITGAAKALGMSYRRAWLLVDSMNHTFRKPVVETLTGGSHGGGTAVTAIGEEVIRRYRRTESLARKAGAAEIAALLKLLSR
jgi:molybdate transport system regulatory protein